MRDKKIIVVYDNEAKELSIKYLLKRFKGNKLTMEKIEKYLISKKSFVGMKFYRIGEKRPEELNGR